MDIWKEKNHVFNIRLAKLISLYQILDPRTAKYRGRNVYHIGVAIIMMYLCVISMILVVSGLYYWTDSVDMSIDYCWKGIIQFFLTYKMWIVVYRSNDLWNCLTITRYNFTSRSIRNRDILDRWRERSVWLTTTMAAVYLMSMAFFVGSSLAFRDDKITVKNHDGSVGYYRQNLLNLYLTVSDETYNAHYDTFYFVEALFTALLTILFLVFDILLVTLCLAVSCQAQMVNTAFESVGEKSLCDPHTPIIDNTDEKKNVSNRHDLIYDELKSIIKDHQAVMKKFDELLLLFKRVMLFQVFTSSISLIKIWFSFMMSFSGEDRLIIASEVTTIKMLCLIPSFSFQIFIVCYLFDNLHKQKDLIIFALYSSNWAEMNMKCKKLILLTMKINNANQNKLKFTRTKIVNLELFFHVMRNCYSIVSVLIKCLKVKNE